MQYPLFGKCLSTVLTVIDLPISHSRKFAVQKQNALVVEILAYDISLAYSLVKNFFKDMKIENCISEVRISQRSSVVTIFCRGGSN